MVDLRENMTNAEEFLLRMERVQFCVICYTTENYYITICY